MWTLDGEVISTDPVLEWVADRYTEKNTYNLLLEITDNKTDIVYRCVYGVSVLEPYDGSTGCCLYPSGRSAKCCRADSKITSKRVTGITMF